MYGQFPSKDNFIAIQLETVFNPPHVQDTFMTERETIKALCSKREWEFPEVAALGNWSYGKPWPQARHMV